MSAILCFRNPTRVTYLHRASNLFVALGTYICLSSIGLNSAYGQHSDSRNEPRETRNEAVAETPKAAPSLVLRLPKVPTHSRTLRTGDLDSYKEALAEAQKLCTEAVKSRHPEILMYGVGQHEVQSLKKTWPDAFGGLSGMRHSEHIMNCKEVQLTAYYSATEGNQAPRDKSKSSAAALSVAFAPLLLPLVLIENSNSIPQGKFRGITVIQPVCTPRDDKDRRILALHHACSHSLKQKSQEEKRQFELSNEIRCEDVKKEAEKILNTNPTTFTPVQSVSCEEYKEASSNFSSNSP